MKRTPGFFPRTSFSLLRISTILVLVNLAVFVRADGLRGKDDLSQRRRLPQLEPVGDNGWPFWRYPLGLCQGDCDDDSECQDG
eukprot:CAMPEP_0172548782 /NCGR_PEP_ID=MMETSP1067-20121228/18002_1 /TAXON_ID=265564 ORGANISM="Thalassiosira punctigera, Strain Tpunct2005C2" /NCGR_SAMPLE_ID=MMETSP1067 /ASSEMBLY_ACC=CAM_ASM_000444 /LENGTH=82 /DNA_ID=CAMNT_0013336047 /DNA_START=60 /DNA_END=304 /DNA_ORIENTATION=-